MIWKYLNACIITLFVVHYIRDKAVYENFLNDTFECILKLKSLYFILLLKHKWKLKFHIFFWKLNKDLKMLYFKMTEKDWYIRRVTERKRKKKKFKWVSE